LWRQTEQEALEVSSGKGRGFSWVVPVVFEGAGVQEIILI